MDYFNICNISIILIIIILLYILNKEEQFRMICPKNSKPSKQKISPGKCALVCGTQSKPTPC